MPFIRSTWPANTSRTQDDEQSSLEKRINQLTATVENMQKIMDRFIALYESEKLQTLSQGQRRQGISVISINEEREKNDAENQAYKMELLHQVEIHDQQKRQWEQERTQLQTELQHYKSLYKKSSTYNSSTQTVPIDRQYVQSGWSRYANCKPLSYSSKDHQRGEALMQKLPTFNSSSQTFSTEFVNNAIKRNQSGCIKPYKCLECGKSYRHKFNLKRHQDKCVPNKPEYSCVFCDQEFFQIDDFKKHLQTLHGSSEANKPTKDSLTESRSTEKIVDNKRIEKVEGSIELHCEPTVTKEEEKRQQEQIVQQSVEVDQIVENLQDTLHISKNQDEKPKINLSHSISKLLTPPSLMRVHEKPATDVSLSLTIPSVNLIDDQARKKFRKNLMLLLEQHKCDNFDCLVASFRNSINHAKDCTLGSNCQLYICKQKYSRFEHLKVCDTKCPECWIYRRFIVNEKYMMTILEMDCVAKRHASGGGVFLTAVTTYYVNYGLADIEEENVVTETQLSSHQEENERNLSASEDDEAAGWELLESELQNVENDLS